MIDFENRFKQRFCSHRCAGLVLNKIRKKATSGPPRTRPRCEICNRIHKMSGGRCRINEQDRKKWLIKTRGHQCERCMGSQWMGQNIPLELDHADGNAGNNKPNNIRLLCPNCHAQTPTAKGKNRGNGRMSRGLPKH
jgi:hypothetical protein